MRSREWLFTSERQARNLLFSTLNQQWPETETAWLWCSMQWRPAWPCPHPSPTGLTHRQSYCKSSNFSQNNRGGGGENVPSLNLTQTGPEKKWYLIPNLNNKQQIHLKLITLLPTSIHAYLRHPTSRLKKSNLPNLWATGQILKII